MTGSGLEAFALDGRVALVTGSSRGIGETIAEALLAAGARVVLNGRDAEALAATRARLAERFGAASVLAERFDVLDDGAVDAAVDRIEESVGPLRILVNNAGTQHRVPLLDLARQDWDRVVAMDLSSAFVVGRSVARRMVARGTGKIVNIGSVQSELARPGIGPYTAAKGGLRNLTRAMAAEWGPSGLQANALAPGYIATEMTRPLVEDATFNAWVVGRTPAARWGSTADLAGPAVWLASDASDFVNGQTIYVDGGMTVVV